MRFPSSTPRDRMSAALSSDSTCRHCFSVLPRKISVTLFATNVLSARDSVLIQCNTMIESDQKVIFWNVRFNALVTFRTNFINNTAAHNSNLIGMEESVVSFNAQHAAARSTFFRGVCVMQTVGTEFFLSH